MRRDFYWYGRSEGSQTTAFASRAEVEVFVCGGCGCSATAEDEALVNALGWRILPRHAGAGVERPALCAACARKGLTGVS